jgi:hypothetical protein
MSAGPVEPTRGKATRAFKLLVSVAYVMTPLGLLIYRLSNGEAVDTLILLLVVTVIFVSLYTLYGESKVDKAVETAKDVAGKEEE